MVEKKCSDNRTSCLVQYRKRENSGKITEG